MMLPMSCYFDDFIIPAPLPLSGNTQASVVFLFDILSWAFDRSGDKADVFSACVEALGVRFLLDRTGEGVVQISNTERRTKEALELIGGILLEGKLSHKHALVVRGRLAFCNALIFRRTGRLALQMISNHAYQKPFSSKLQKHVCSALEALRCRIFKALPRGLSATFLDTHYLYTDASFQPALTGG